MSQVDQWAEMNLCFILPCGTVTLPFEDGTLTCRSSVGHLDTPETGLIAEMEAGTEPTPWRSADRRDEALASIESRRDLDDAMRQLLLDHVRRTPWFE